jgi:hypothetical protein
MLGLRTAPAIPRRLFKPDQMASLKAWYVSGDNGGSGLQTGMTDRQGNANASGGDALNPSLVIPAFNGHRAIQWSGSSSSARFSLGTSLLVGSSSGAFFACYQCANDPPSVGRGGAVFDGFTNDVTGNRNSHQPYEDGTIYEHFGTDTRKTVGNPTPSMSSTQRIYSAHSASGDFRSYLDGTQLFSTGTNSVDFGSGVTKYIGGSFNGTMFNGKIAEIVAFNSSLTTAERQKVEGYLAWKYGIASQLPGSHPHLNAAPLAIT